MIVFGESFGKTSLRFLVYIKQTKHISSAGLPDGLFSDQKSQFRYFIEGLGMEYVGIYYDHLK
jgi:hypothetical protein